MDRDKHIKLADQAITRAERLAGRAESAAINELPVTAIWAAAAGAWSDIARTHAAIAGVLPQTED
ncbi:hypothetical protein ACFVZZ_18820 [Streptomyces chartreusis]|uniref:hypothetical protein n=1 Tax=Streptomyces chartreusis TaxID=1969 RepID=UPI0036D80C67